MKRTFVATAAAAGILLAAAAFADVISLTLREMLERADSAVLGSVVDKTTWRGPLAGFPEDPEFTTITVDGEDVVTGKKVKREITYLGSEAIPISEMPAESETRIGARGVFFSETINFPWGGRGGLNSLTTAQNGVFRIEAGPKGDVVVGKGEGTAIESNTFAADFRKKVAATLDAIRKGR